MQTRTAVSRPTGRATLRVALVGVGHVAEHQIAAIQRVPGVELQAAHDRDPRRAALLPSGVTFFDTLDDLLTRSTADIFAVATPNLSHFEIGQAILDRDRALLLEKPVCNSDTELDGLLSLAASRKQFFSVALHAAFARDVEWWLAHQGRGELDLGPVTGFDAGFFDPYVRDGHVLPQARGLGGSWFDSGINALSVIGRFVALDNLRLDTSRMTALPQLPCSEHQGSATFSFDLGGRRGRGLVDTNWTLGRNCKTTRLFYDDANAEVLLHHSGESVRIEQHGNILATTRLATAYPRLTNHYMGLFEDLAGRFRTGRDNLDYAAPLHRLLFAAREGGGEREEGTGNGA